MTWFRRFGALVAVLTVNSVNRKTGPMSQLWILPWGIHYLRAIRTGRDRVVCGDCRARPSAGGWCYVEPRPLLSLWRTRRCWRPLVLNELPQVPLRMGAWGDPAFLPFEFLSELVQHHPSHTGYTHQWRSCDPAMKTMLMASVDTPEERELAKRKGWRTFRTRLPGERVLPGEMECASKRGQLCFTCLACDGWPRKPDVTIVVHGSRAARYVRWRDLLTRTGPVLKEVTVVHPTQA